MNIKVCGITQMQQLIELDEIGIDFAGLNFYERSPRFVQGKLNGSEVIVADLDIRKVGVFVNESESNILRTIEEFNLDAVQLHGDEKPAFCRRLAEKTEVIRTFRITSATTSLEDVIQPFDDACDYYLFDTGGQSESLGGTGQQFDWNVLQKSRIEKPFFLAGGIGLADVARVKSFKHPDLFAVDLNSRFEINPGIKDMDLVRMFAQVLKN
ncbi:MAG TPA: phosphoribosylanthranilate isomerase [Chitinophagaceae bacterium]|jgi:phosphoribosylanthranilate isomerase